MNEIERILNSTLKPKEKTDKLVEILKNKTITTEDLIHFAMKSKDPTKAGCIEAIEYVTQSFPSIITEKQLIWIIDQLTAKPPRIKWESAKVIANTISLYPQLTSIAVEHLLSNTKHAGTVVRWSAATALSRIAVSESTTRPDMPNLIAALAENEEKSSIKKIYQLALQNIKNKTV